MSTARPLSLLFALLAAGSAGLIACGTGPKASRPGEGARQAQHCGGLDQEHCQRAGGMVRAANGFGNVHHEYLIDPASSLSPGRCVANTGDAAYALLPHACATPKPALAVTGEAAPSERSAQVDFTYVGLAIDRQLVGAEASLAPWASVGGEAAEKKISLVAMAFVRDDDPQYFEAGGEVQFQAGRCTHGRATHFVGARKLGGMLAYEMTVRSAELHGSALGFFQARLAAGDTRITQTTVGGLEVSGLELGGEPSVTESVAQPLSFHVKNPVPIAYAVYPLSDVCKFAFPAPEVSPQLVEFGDVPYGVESQQLVHVQNRANLDLNVELGGRSWSVPALGSLDLPIQWTPNGSRLGCERQERQETLLFRPAHDAPVTPKSQSVRVTERVRTGRPSFTRHEHIDTGVHSRPDYALTTRQWECPADYQMQSCRTENLQCGDASCTEKGYAINAAPEGNGCRFTCTGPKGLIPGLSSYFCRFDAVMECALACQ